MNQQNTTSRRRDPEARTREILDAATAIIKQEGTAELTHRAVAARSGLALGTVTKYFPAIDILREQTLIRLSDEIDAELDKLEPTLLQIDTEPEKVARAIYDYLLDRHQVRADLTLMVAGAYETDLRHLALRWTNRMTDILACRIGRKRATALAIFFDGMTVTSALSDLPVNLQLIADTILAVLGMGNATGQIIGNRDESPA